MKKARLRICNQTDVKCLFSAHYVGGGRGFEDCPALEAYSNELAPCIKTIMGFTLIVEPTTNDEQEIGENAAGGGDSEPARSVDRPPLNDNQQKHQRHDNDDR